MLHQKSRLGKQLERARSTATAAMVNAKSTGSGKDAELARVSLGTVNQLQERMRELDQDILDETTDGNLGLTTKRLEGAKYSLNHAQEQDRQLRRKIEVGVESLRYARQVDACVNLPDRMGRTAVYFATGKIVSVLVVRFDIYIYINGHFAKTGSGQT